MIRFAAALDDLDRIWRTPAGAALVEAAIEDHDDAEVVSVRGTDAVVLRGTWPRVAALVAAFVGTRLAPPVARTVRVFADDGCGWQRVTTPPEVPRLPDEQPGFDAEAEEEGAAEVPDQQPGGRDRTCQPRRAGPERASSVRASRYCTSGIGA